MLDHLLREQPLWVALHASDPGERGLGEIEGGGYRRLPVAWSTAGEGLSSNLETIEWEDLAAVTLSYAAVWDAAAGGQMLLSSRLPAGNVTISDGSVFRIRAGQFSVSL